jgi:hypothetical protein
MNQRIVFWSIIIFASCVLSMSCAPVEGTAGKLLITEGDYPRVLYFRQSERTKSYESYEQWEDHYDDLMGLIGQALPYQLSDADPGTLDLTPGYFTRFKERHPDHLVLLHFIGNDHDRRHAHVFHPSHWLYFEPAKIVADVPAEPGQTDIQVSDASLFSLDNGFMGADHEPDDVGLCMMDATGKPDWDRSEQVALVAIDTENNVITVERGLYGATPRAFPAGQAYAAAHVPGGPMRNHIDWQYNYATCCPVDARGRNCADRVIELLLDELGPDGPLYNLDGVTLDVLWNLPDMRPNRGVKRLPDFDADGVGDDLSKDSRFSVGVVEFLADLKAALGPDRFVCADGYRLTNQRAFGVINGVETEGWPRRNDHFVDNWSYGTNNLLFWHENTRRPKLSYMNHAYGWVDYSEIGAHHARLVMAASTLTNAIYVLSKAGPPGTPSTVLQFTPDPEDDFADIWDELVMGKERKLGWLGKPLGPAVRMATLQQDELGGDGAPPNRNLLKKLTGTDVVFTLDGGAVKVEPRTSDMIRFELRDVPCQGSDLTVLMTARCDPKQGYPPAYARLMIGSTHRGLPFPDPSLDWQVNEDNRYCTYVNHTEFTSGFYFRGQQQGTVDLEFTVEGTAPIWITGLRAHSHPDAMYREFENGLVLANPSDSPYEFDLAELFPDQRFRRIRGSPDQDPETNDGSPVQGKVALQARDGLFLVRMQ